MMKKSALEAVWVPRIGSAATDELRRFRRSSVSVMAMPVVAGVGGLLIGTSALGDVLGMTLLAVAAWCVAAFIRGQRRLAAAMSDWFGVTISAGQLPLMNPKRFDVWCERTRLDGQAEQPGATPRRPLKLKYDHKWGPIRWSVRPRRDPDQ
jgi:hypothetical protein